MEEPLNKKFPVAYITREDLMHPLLGFTLHEAMMVSDEQMKEVARILANNASNQIPKSALKLIVNITLKK